MALCRGGLSRWLRVAVPEWESETRKASAERMVTNRLHNGQLRLRRPGEPWVDTSIAVIAAEGADAEVFILPIPSVLGHGAQSSC